MRFVRRFAMGLIASAMAVLVPVGFAWACVGLVSLTTNSATVQPGGTLTVTGKEFAAGAPVDIHLDTVTGPVLASAPPPKTTMTSVFNIDVVIPQDVSAGQHLLVATQNEHNMNGGIPARAVIYVGTSAPAAPGPAARPLGLVASSGPSPGSLVLIGLGVAAAGLLLAGSLTLVASRRSSEAKPERVGK